MPSFFLKRIPKFPHSVPVFYETGIQIGSRIMDEGMDFTMGDLERCSYRYLQQLAKSLNLPSNVKKIYLMQLIFAKKYRSESEVNNIVQKVKLERQQLAQSNKKKGARKKMHLQGSEISSTNPSQSPPITKTPKRPGFICNPDPQMLPCRSQPKFYSPKTRGSDRVLRSFNLKAYKRPNYSILNNTVIGVIKAERSTNEKAAQISIISQGGRYPKLNFATRCVVTKHRPSILSSNSLKNTQLVPISESSISPMPTKRQRTLSGIYPLTTQVTRTNTESFQSIGFRRTDGKISKINALVQKSSKYSGDTQTCNNLEVTIEDVIDCNLDDHTFGNQNCSDYFLSESTNYPNMSGLTDVLSGTLTSDTDTCRETDTDESFSVYYHKKIRAERVKPRHQNVPRNVANELPLPKINNVFSKFNDYNDIMEPLYVQVSQEPERTECPPTTKPCPPLETLYNLRQEFTGQPLQHVTTTNNTRCVFSAPMVVTAMAQETSAANTYEQARLTPYERDNQYQSTNDDVSRMYEYLRLAEQEITLRKYHEVFNSSSDSQDLGASVTIPEMVEDALEIISQDGDYMERIGMDVRMQCILCSWAGPKFILEHHIRKDHSEQIQQENKSEWNITYKLGSLVQQPLWLSSVTEYDGILYALSVKYEAESLSVALSTLSSDTDSKTGTINIYNKVTGEPYTWEGHIELIPSNMPYENDSSHLKLDISRLELLPNSANLKLNLSQSGRLVVESPSKAVVGRVELNDIHIIVFVKIS